MSVRACAGGAGSAAQVAITKGVGVLGKSNEIIKKKQACARRIVAFDLAARRC